MIRLTDKAVAHIQGIIQRKKGVTWFRLSIKKTGCSGLMYVPSVVSEPGEKDHIVAEETRLHFCVDSAWLSALENCEVDYVTKSLGQSQLIFNNPQANSLCGCGESFHLKEGEAS